MFDIESLFTKAATQAEDFARSSGIPLPLDRDINALTAKDAALKSVSLRASAAYHLMADRPGADMSVLTPLRSRIMKAQSRATNARKILGQAIAQGKLAQEKLKYGTAAANPTATFLARQKVAVAVANFVEKDLRQLIAECGALQRAAFGSSPSLIRGAAQATYATAREFTGKAARGLVSVGTVAEKAASAAESGAEQYAGLAKYAIPALVVFAGIYAWSVLPHPRSQS